MRQGHSLVSESAGFRSIKEGYLSKSTTGKGYIQLRLHRLVVVNDRSDRSPWVSSLVQIPRDRSAHWRVGGTSLLQDEGIY